MKRSDREQEDFGSAEEQAARERERVRDQRPQRAGEWSLQETQRAGPGAMAWRAREEGFFP